MYKKFPISSKITAEQEAEYRLEMGLAAFGGPGALKKYLEAKEQKEKTEIKTNKKGRK